MGEMNIEIHRVFEATTNWAEDIMVLAQQVTRKAVAFNREALVQVITHGTLLAALQSDEKIVGMALLVTVQAPTGCHGIIMDFSVLPHIAGQGLEDRLIAALVEEAESDRMRSLLYDSSRAGKTVREAFSRSCFKEAPPGLFRLDFKR
jgi:GNAT superfamily N-acetyltransferase